MRFMYTGVDGRAIVVMAAPRENLEQVLGPLTEENYMAHVLGKSLPQGVKEVIVLSDDWTPPQSREFRNAWVISDGRIAVDMPKARNIHRDRLRFDRATQFNALDVEAQRAMETKDDAALAKVAAAKQRLRDAPAHPAIEKASTPEELSSITLADLT